MVLTRTLYGEEAAKRPDLLPEQDKERIRTLSSAVVAVVGGVSGSRDSGGNAVDVLSNAQVGGVVGRNAVENNYLLESDWSDYYRQMRACGNNERCIDNTREWLTRRSAWRNFLLDGICHRDIQRCREKHTDATRSARLTSIHMNIGRGPILSNPQNIKNSRFSTSTPRYDPRRPDFNTLSYYDRVAKNIQPSDYLLTREKLNTLNQLAKHPAIQEEYRNNPSFRSEFKSEAEAAMRASFGDNEMWMRDEPKLYGFEIINRQNPQNRIQYPVGAGGLKPVYPELWLMPAPKIGILGSFSSKLFAGLERSGGGKVLQWMARVQPASERALVLNARKPALQTMVGGYSQQTIVGQRIRGSVGIIGSNSPVTLPHNINYNVLKQALDRATPTAGHPNQLMYTLTDGTRVIFRKDFGANAHPIRNIFPGKGSIDHYNIEVQIPKARGGVRVIENLHIVPNSSGGFTWWDKDGVIRK